MLITLKGNLCIIEREPGDPKFHGVRNGAGESKLLHAVKIILNKLGFDLIKKRMHKDGHMVDDMQQYLRCRNINRKDAFCIYSPFWAIRGANEDFNSGKVTLTLLPLNEGSKLPSIAENKVGI